MSVTNNAATVPDRTASAERLEAGRYQLGLINLAWLTASIALLAAIYQYMGFDNPTWNIAFGFWWVASLIFVFSDSTRIGGIFGMSVLLLLSLCMVGTHPFVVILFSFLALVILMFVCVATRGFFVGFGKAKLDRWYLAVISLAFGMGFWMLIPNRGVTWILKKRTEFSVVDLGNQLEFEKRGPAEITPAFAEDSANGLADLENLLGDESGMGTHPLWVLSSNIEYRNQTLRQIHDDQYLRFIRTEGFGSQRMIPVWHRSRRKDLTVPPPDRFVPDPRNWPGSLPWPAESDGYGQQELSVALFKTARRQSLEDLHFLDVVDFVNPAGWGWSQEFRHSAGFVQHAIYVAPDTTQNAGQTFALNKLQLVTIDRFDEPRAFVLDELPRMDKITGENVPTRALTEFEKRGLAELIAGKDIFFETNPPALVMVGAIRAAKQCVQCHDAQRGELLGAFTYELSAIPPEPLFEDPRFPALPIPFDW